MKNILKKNQIIITALAIMIVIAGYLSFTNDDKKKDANTAETVNAGMEDADAITGTEDTGLADNTADITDAADTKANTGKDGDAAAVDEQGTDTAAKDTDQATVPVDKENETADISDEDILNTAKNVTDTGELDLDDDESTPGEAVLASTILDEGYFSSAKLTREQMRARNRETLMSIIDSPELTEADKKAATDKLIDQTTTAEKENSIEILLQAKGFDEAVVSIGDKDVEVIVNAPSINDQQTAIIEELVSRKAEVSIDQITITPVVMGE